MDQNPTTRSPQKISSALAAAQAQSGLPVSVRFPGEDGGQSLGEMAQRDLDAALQLLADRAQYITGATGAAIALRRDGMDDMLCRASTGTNAPELGALLSTEFGLSGESVRTKRALRCDDAERDARVNRDVCRQLGIASVVVMPVVNDDQVLGVFELFSGKANAFGERDLTAIQRLSEMVETAVRLAHAGELISKKQPKQGSPAIKASKPGMQDGQFVGDLVVDRKVDQPATVKSADVAPTSRSVSAAAKSDPPMPKVAPSTPKPVQPAFVQPKKPLFWSAAPSPEGEAVKSAEAEQSLVPPVLRGLRKCEACGFPVTAGRTLCVECEEKKWRGQLRPQARTAAIASVSVPSPSFTGQAAAAAPSMAKVHMAVTDTSSSIADTVLKSAGQVEAAKSGEVAPDGSSPNVAAIVTEQHSQGEQAAMPDFILSAGVQPSQSWLASNKYILGVLLVIAAVAVAVNYLR
ncbi:MAG: GAF domain-containing protein [Candidatus Sulfotelmatobacter sp.]